MWKSITVPSYPDMSPADLRVEIGYIDPPAALSLPHYHSDPDGKSWQALHTFFKDQGIEDLFGAAVIYLAEMYDKTLYEAEDLWEEYEGNVYQNYN